MPPTKTTGLRRIYHRLVWPGDLFDGHRDEWFCPHHLGMAVYRFGHRPGVNGILYFRSHCSVQPIAGALVDRWNKKLVMALSDVASGLSTIAIFILYTSGDLQLWHMYVAGAFSGIFQAFQWPAYSAAISVMVPKEQYARAAGMMSLAEWGSGIFAPVLAGALVGLIGIGNILLIDIATFMFAVGVLLIIYIPPVPVSHEGKESRGSLWKESLFGFKYIWSRPSLFGLQLIFFFGNMMSSLAGVLLSPMILARTGDNAQLLGLVMSVGSAGGIAGSLLMTAWGGPKKRVNGVIFGWMLGGMLGQFMFGLKFGVPIWMVSAFFFSFFGPVINSSNQAIWQSKVPPDLQGRVFLRQADHCASYQLRSPCWPPGHWPTYSLNRPCAIQTALWRKHLAGSPALGQARDGVDHADQWCINRRHRDRHLPYPAHS